MNLQEIEQKYGIYTTTTFTTLLNDMAKCELIEMLLERMTNEELDNCMQTTNDMIENEVQ